MKGLLILFCFGLALAAEARDGRTVDSAELRNVMIPLYHKRDLSLLANVRIGRVFPDYERKGFFRVGLFPLLAGENVQIEVLQGRRTLNALARIQQRFTTRQRRVVEWRNVEFIFPPETPARMRVGRIRMLNEERWELLDGVCLQSSTDIAWPKAVLFLSGPNAGHVKSGAESVELFRKEP